MIDKKNQLLIGIFVDYPNIEISLQEYVSVEYPDISMVKRYATRLGKIALLKVYGDWNRLQKQRQHLKKVPGTKLINEPHLKTRNGKKKDAVDMRMAFDIGACLEKSPQIDLYILVSGDADFLPVLRQIRIRGKEILIIAEQNSLSWLLKRKFKNIITYQELESYFARKQLVKWPSSKIPLKLEEVVV